VVEIVCPSPRNESPRNEKQMPYAAVGVVIIVVVVVIIILTIKKLMSNSKCHVDR
jgi:hypothetical protein